MTGLINSGYNDFEYARKVIQIKAISYLTKPLDLEELRVTVSETIRILTEYVRGVRMEKARELLLEPVT